ncbi:hypothetical protein AB1Y20_005640 [Prymnesium parvum]|uniref:Uncharacterized protein n=1 Tax=Prymnesium parvum TaxID=97485 RepID=A0AB34J4R8_PRYPA
MEEVRCLTVNAPRRRVWAACFSHMHWERWDPDISGLADLRGGLEDGSTFSFVMKKGPVRRIPCVLSRVKEPEGFSFGGRAAGGLFQFCGTILLSEESPHTTQIKYSFSMSGCLGSLASKLDPTAVIGGVEQGLANMKSLAEASPSK